MSQKDSNTAEKELKAENGENMNVTNVKKESGKQSDESEPEHEEEKQEVNGKNKELKKVTKEEKCSPDRVTQADTEAEKRVGSAKKKAISSFFGKFFFLALYLFVNMQHFFSKYNTLPLSSKAPKKASAKLEKTEEKSVQKSNGDKSADASVTEDKEKNR